VRGDEKVDPEWRPRSCSVGDDGVSRSLSQRLLYSKTESARLCWLEVRRK
jgi:hypothetical protein